MRRGAPTRLPSSASVRCHDGGVDLHHDIDHDEMLGLRGPDFSWAGASPEPLDGYVETTTFADGAMVERIWWG